MTADEDFKRVILKDCYERALKGDADAGLDIAKIFLEDIPTGNIELLLCVFEVLISQAAQLGSGCADEYLKEIWPDIRFAVERSLLRKGASGSLEFYWEK